VIIPDMGRPRYFGRMVSGAETSRVRIWLMAIVRAFIAEVLAVRRIPRHSTGPSLVLGVEMPRSASAGWAAWRRPVDLASPGFCATDSLAG
jgi:hypothetical protein